MPGTAGAADHVANVRTLRTRPLLPDEAAIDVPARLDAAGAVAQPLPPVPPLARGLISAVAAYEELGIQAAIHGGRERVVRALLAHPLIGQIETAEARADRLIAENAEWLPWSR